MEDILFISTLLSPRTFAGLLACICLIGLAPAHAQSDNVDLQSNFDPSGFDYADIWGYDSGGTEIAILMDNNGTYFVDVTDPTSPNQVGFIDGPNSTWRDAKTYDQYAYIVTEASGGLQIVSLVDPLNPSLVGTVTSQFQTSHNVWIDQELGLLFAVGADYSNGVQQIETDVYDLDGDIIGGASPTNPGFVYNFNDFYVHDMYSQGGVAYMAAVYQGYLATVDLTQLPGSMPVLDTIFTDDLFTHNVWTSEDGAYAFTTDETGGGHVTIIDVSNPNDMFRVGQYTNPDDPSSIIHNVAVNGNFLHVSWYRSGYEVVDITAPGSPQRVGYYDTSPSSGPGFSGAWGVYPFAPSGNVYVSDMQTGLYVFKLDDTFGFAEGTVTDQDSGLPIENVTVAVEGTSFSATTDDAGFYHLLLDAGNVTLTFDNFFYFPDEADVVIGGGAITDTDVALVQRPSGALDGVVSNANTTAPIPNADVAVDATPLASTTDGAGAYAFDPVPEGTYLVSGDAFGYAPASAGATITEATTTTTNLSLTPALVADDMEADQGWQVLAGANTGNWERVDPVGTAAQPEDDHTRDPGVQCWVTGQGQPGGSVGDDDVDGGSTTLVSPVYDVSGASDATFSFYSWFVNDAGSSPGEDPFVVDVTTDGSAWVNVLTTFESYGFWKQTTFSLSDLALTPTSQVQLRFVAVDAGNGSIVEAAVDDLEVFGDAVVAVDPSVTIGLTRLMPVSPNPFRADALVRFELAGRADVSLNVYDVQGRLVRRLASGVIEAGVQSLRWDGRTLGGAQAAPGVYYVRLETPSITQSQKLVRTQ